MDLSVEYLGQRLKNPIVIGSSGLTSSVNKLKSLEKAGAGAVILKSLFEEQVGQENWNEQAKNSVEYPEAMDYIAAYSNEKSFEKYLELIRNAKKELSIPVFASINCISVGNWISYAKKIEEAGADGIELNVALLPNDFDLNAEQNEQKYFEIIEKVSGEISIPLSLKMSNASSGLANLISRLSWTKKIDSFVLFNRFFRPDFDIDTLEMKAHGFYTSSEDIIESLRWVMVLSKRIKTPIIANTGIHTGADVVKQILAGAQAVQIVSEIYQNGEGQIAKILSDIEDWMKKHGHKSLGDFRGNLHYNENVKKGFERIQFMKYYGSIE